MCSYRCALIPLLCLLLWLKPKACPFSLRCTSRSLRSSFGPLVAFLRLISEALATQKDLKKIGVRCAVTAIENLKELLSSSGERRRWRQQLAVSLSSTTLLYCNATEHKTGTCLQEVISRNALGVALVWCSRCPAQALPSTPRRHRLPHLLLRPLDSDRISPLPRC